MKNKKMIIVLAGLLVISFVATFFVSGMLGVGKKAPAPPGLPQTDKPTVTEAPAVIQLDPKGNLLSDLERSLREKIDLCDKRTKELDEREKRVRMMEDALRKPVKDLEDLRMNAVASLNPLNERLKQIQQQLVMVDATERENLKRIAAIYDKMDSAASSQIVVEMSKGPRFDDAVKLLRYMQDRAVAKLLAEMPDKALAARLSERLKGLREQQEG